MRRRTRPITWLCLTAFLVANGPLRFAPIAHFGAHCDHGETACCHAPGAAPTVEEDDDCCCHACPDGTLPTATQPTHRSECPFCPNSPNGCCWRCAAKAPCSLPTPPSALAVAPLLEARLAEGRLTLPLPPALELLQPPRA